MNERCFLLLQGVCSPFFAALAAALQRSGARVHKLHFNAGDRWGWHGAPAESYRGSVAGLPAYLQDCHARLGVTDQILFGDQRPLHRVAQQVAQAADITTHVFEEGYFRPWWVTLEREGVNRKSSLPRDPAWFRAAARTLPPPEPPRQFRQLFFTRARHDVAYHLAGMLNPLWYPRYRTHAEVSAPREYAGYVRRYVRVRARRAQDAACTREVLAGRVPFYLLPLQLNGDAQVRQHSRFADMRELLLEVLESFARHAPADALLVVKNHPLDYARFDYAGFIARFAREYALGSRVIYLESAALDPLVARAAGVVTINSTVGSLALDHNRPTLALGEAIYRLPGLTFSGRLDEFWRNATPPDPALRDDFRQVVLHTTQLNGGFYAADAIELAVAAALPELLAAQSALQRLRTRLEGVPA